jgi:transcriptional regulator with XRE-family HTH domain
MMDMWDMEPPDLNRRIGARVADLRSKKGLSLKDLAELSGVSRSMISLIERGATSPTAVVLEKLAAALNVPLAALFDSPLIDIGPVARRADQPTWRDPDSGYLRCNVSPAGVASPIQIVEVSFPPKARVAYDSAGRQPTQHQQVWVLEGRIEVSVGDDRHDLQAGDCLAFVLDRPTAFHNRTDKPARYAVVVVAGLR